MVFEIDAFFVSLKEELPNKSVSGIWELLPLKKYFHQCFEFCWEKLIVHLRKIDSGVGNEQ